MRQEWLTNHYSPASEPGFVHFGRQTAGVWIIQSLLALLSDQFSPSRVKPGSLTLAPDVILTAGSVAIGAGAPQ